MSDPLLIQANKQWVLCEAGKIIALGTEKPPTLENGQVIDAPHLTLLPGFIDIHMHGAMGLDTMDATGESIRGIAQFLARHGVTSFLATTWTDSFERIEKALYNATLHLGGQEMGATLLGVHLEGPYLNPEKCGAQNQEHIRHAQADEWFEWLDYNVIRIVSIAPEFEENHAFIQEAYRQGVRISAAHTNATYQEMLKAHELGLRHSTHTFNAMRGFHHREPGVVGAVLTLPDVSCELIADGFHVSDGAIRLLWQNKGADNLILISDSVSPTGLNVNTYDLDGRPATISNMTIRLEDGTLAGSLLTLDLGLKHFMHTVNETLERVWQTSSLNAARALGIDDHKGRLAVGYDADLVLLDKNLNVKMTVVNGNIVYQGEEEKS